MRSQRDIVAVISLFIVLILFLCPTAIYAQMGLDGKSVCIDPGHGGSDPGCPGYNGDAYPDEADITLQICHDFLEGYINYAGGNVYVTRITDVNPIQGFGGPPYSDTYRYRVAVANGETPDAYGYRAPDGGVDYFVSVHCNSSGNPNAHGTQIMVWGPDTWNTNVNTNTNRFRMALNIVNAYVSTTEDIYWDAGIWENGPGWVDQPDEGYTPPTDGIYGRDDLWVIKHTIMPANLVETEFATNPTAWGHLTDSLWSGGYQDYAAHGITFGLIGFTGGTWGPDVRLTYDDPCLWPAITVSGSKVHVVWQDWWKNIDIYYNRSDDGGCSWGIGRRLTYSDSFSINGAMAAARGSNVYLVWSDCYSGIFFKRSLDDGNSWSENVQLSYNPNCEYYYGIPDIVVGDDGRIHIVWDDNREGQFEIYYICSLNGGTSWEPETRLTYTGGTGCPKIMADAFGNVHIVWNKYVGKGQEGDTLYQPWANIYRGWRRSLGKGGPYEIYYMRSTNGGDIWGPEIRLAHGSGTSMWPSVATDGSGRVHVVWSDSRDNPEYWEVYYKRSTNGGDSWGPDTRLTYGGANRRNWTMSIIATDGSDWEHIVWVDERDDNYNGDSELYYKRSMDGGETWELEKRLTNASGAGYNPSMATDDYNRVHIVWGEEYRVEDVAWNIYYKRSGFGCDGWEVSVDQVQEAMAIPSQYSLSQNYPNPFNPDTRIEYSLPQDSQVKLTVYNTLGQRVKTLVNEEQKSGFHTVRWNGENEEGRDVSSGIYFYRMVAGNFSQTKKMVILK
ncbi:hypothetical protein AMJ44_14390 [candidate division WOR-1 bacterium DG_54_3]|uniref:MurNAc-LAA domain-containing protein n=1 Tax=candidate division WOR-1 bacterium DG_54_3 TaxID=1703775 RepID=A0A0S7XMP2_UNCSA|nr:MAG: hypothetical protein AMJ44_14390 [candidate division WOR-1 bacterium DG_54_3]